MLPWVFAGYRADLQELARRLPAQASVATTECCVTWLSTGHRSPVSAVVHEAVDGQPSTARRGCRETGRDCGAEASTAVISLSGQHRRVAAQRYTVAVRAQSSRGAYPTSGWTSDSIQLICQLRHRGVSGSGGYVFDGSSPAEPAVAVHKVALWPGRRRSTHKERVASMHGATHHHERPSWAAANGNPRTTC